MKMKYLKNVVSLQLDPEACVGCGRCVEVCPRGVFILEGGKSRIVDRDGCLECGACGRNCAGNAISVKNGVGCAIGILNASLGRSDVCCGEQGACSGE
jgi:NAD-dependent dihydropyrimidine dehydrogenase PreA subunit